MAATLAGPASAAPCPGRHELGPGTESGNEPGQRLPLLRARIDRGARRSRIWALSWGVGLGLLTVGQLALVPAIPEPDRIDFWVGAAASGIGALSRAVFLPTVLADRRRLARLDRRHASECERLMAAEHAIVRGAKWERQGRALWMHGLSLGFNAGVGLVLGLAFDRPVAGNRLAAIGAVVGEVMIVTQPTYMMRTLHEHQRGTLGAPRWRMRPWLLVGGGGFAIAGAM